MQLLKINLIIGYIFLFTGVLGCIALFEVMFQFNIFNGYLLFLSLDGRAALTTPIFLGIISMVGAYLIKDKS